MRTEVTEDRAGAERATKLVPTGAKNAALHIVPKRGAGGGGGGQQGRPADREGGRERRGNGGGAERARLVFYAPLTVMAFS